ncbi:hypothetical protein BGZ80_007181 [Entomortierella chlamydospora]|uniref:Bacteriophage T5 Orf172 DNA-binding domain-containing protein n=1 Tax=Entomortierella chlamydospora TaxID=101097 RepID=A0A9P6MYB1_9FUNG|nr:hypothetical protein BGZ79_004026 [Entomortierella chlamydospora]KAG0018433.1 hypothetical protein BGZ80_007181 [Entomortierella chlamydospora]
MTKATASTSTQDSDNRCKAIAVSTGQRCSRSGKLDGYCSEKHREQALAAASQSNDSETKALDAPGIKKTADAKDVAASNAPKTKTTTAAKKSPKKKAAAKKVVAESSDEFQPSDSDSADSADSDSDVDEDEDDEDVGELTGKLASVKIKPDDPTLPTTDGDSEPRKTKIKRTKSKVFGTGAVLAPPKNKTKASSATGRPTGGFWVPAPPPVTIPESTLKILASVKDKLQSQDGSAPSASGSHSAPEKSPSGLFKYHARVHNFLFAKEDEEKEDPNSKRATMRKIFGEIRSFYHKVKSSAEPEPPKPYEKPLPQKPEGKTVGSGPQYHRPSVDALAQDLGGLSVKSDDKDEVPNQCHGFNKDGHRCKRKVKLDRPIEKGEVLMCHDHEVNEEDEVVVHIEGKGGVLLQWMDLSSWVNPNLPDYVQNKLRRSMEKPISNDDKPGYIYVYQLQELSYTDSHTLFKVGRTDNVSRRMHEWGEKCGSPPRLLEVFPEQGSLAPKDENDLAETASRSAGDDEVTGLRCRYAHRVERLIHIELKPLHDKNHVCACKTKHMEWFKVPHQSGLSEEQQRQQAWLQVRRVIVHWMAYMEHVYGPG